MYAYSRSRHFTLFLVFTAIAVVVAVSAATSSSGFEDCPTKFSILEHALYETGDNMFEMNKVFYPPSKRTSRFIRVNYTFLNEAGEDDGCSVAYIWAIGILLFFQPPKLLMYNSLYFNYPNNDLTTAYLKLPYECRPLINISADEVCSCASDSEQLDTLTQQVNIYAKFTNRLHIERENTMARAVCSEDVYDIYYSGNHKFIFIIVCLTIVLPFVFLVIFIIFIRNINDSAIKVFTQTTKHGILVAMVLNGTIISIAIIIFDILACHVVASNDHEYAHDLRGRSINMYIVFGTLICDTLFILPLLLSILYIVVFNGRNFFKLCCKRNTFSSHWLTSSVGAFVMGRKTLDKIRKLSDNDNITMMFSIMLVTPLLCFSSHIGYMMLAWLTEPSKSTTVLMFFYFLFVYFFFAFSKCYKHCASIDIACKWPKKCSNHDEKGVSETLTDLHENVSIAILHEESDLSVENSDENRSKSDAATNEQQKKSEVDNTTSDYVAHKDYVDCCCLSVNIMEKEHVNTQAFCLLLVFGFFFLGVMVMIVSIIIVLPLSSEELVTYLFNIFQFTVVVISTHIAYKLYFGSSFSLKHVFQKFREAFAQKECNSYNNDLIAIAKDYTRYSEINDATGAFVAEFTDVIVQKFHTNDR